MKNLLSPFPAHFVDRGPVICSALLFMFTSLALAGQTRLLSGHVPAVVTRLNLQPTGRLPATNRMHLAIGLSLRNKDALTNLLQQLYDPLSTNFHRYLAPQQFVERFGPLEQDYQKVIDFAAANRLEPGEKYGNRLVFDVSGTVSDIERAFHLSLRTYRHPTENRDFYAPDTEPSVDANAPVLDISGLDNFLIPHRPRHRTPGEPHACNGSGPSGNYMGNDFRNAYVPGLALNGTGQVVGLLELDNFSQADITAYETLAGLPNVSVSVQHTLTFIPIGDSSEACGDIEMVISMAPGASVAVFEGDFWNDLLGYATGNPQIKQFSSSWTSVPYIGSAEGAYMQLAAQGQSMFQASGDSGANVIQWPSDDPYVTSVGGTALTMYGLGIAYASETVWNWQPGQNASSGGGVSGQFSIPSWQQSVNMASNGGSSTMRNIPDVALTAASEWIIHDNGKAESMGGTSFAAPLWAAFTALVNEQAANQGLSSVGFLNPALYAIGQGPLYASAFHDIPTGNNTNNSSPNQFFAVAGYDLCTGWGTPNGTNLINALMAYSSAVWVDFNYTGSPQNGSYNAPFPTLAQGINAVPTGGNIWIRTPGSSPETMTISKPLTIRAYSGAAAIGH